MLFKTLCSLNNTSSRRWFALLQQTRSITLHPVRIVSSTKGNETFEQKNMRLKRPLSPHLSIYKPQLTTILSITHRISGLALIVYVVAIGASSSYNLEDIILAVNNLHLSPATLFAIKTVLALPVSYHIFNGIRHLIWDVGRGLTIKSVYTSGYVVLAGTIIYSLYLAQV